MQNNESNHKFAHFWKGKGYYMLLALCAAAIGVSGYLFVTGAVEEQKAVEQSLSVPVVTEEPVDTQMQHTEEVPAEQSSASEEVQVSAPVQEMYEETVMPVNGTVLQDYAMDRLVYHATTQDWRVHNGVDLAAPLGQSVRAARNGTVSAVYEDDYLGWTVVLQHTDGYSSHYCSLAETLPVSVGDQVQAGQVLGTVGGTALIEVAEEPHLHFEVYHNGESVDPAGFLY